MVSGHEIAGAVRAVGSKVAKYKVGDHVGVGCFVPRRALDTELATIKRPGRESSNFLLEIPSE